MIEIEYFNALQALSSGSTSADKNIRHPFTLRKEIVIIKSLNLFMKYCSQNPRKFKVIMKVQNNAV